LTGSQRGELNLSRTNYAYDLSGNRTEKINDNITLHSYSTDPNSNHLLSQGGAQTVNYSYDAAGNLTHDGTYSHSYNAAGRRIASTSTATGQATRYGYDALGQRITKTLNGNTVQYFYDEQGHLTGEYDGTGQLIQEIVWLGDLPIAVLKPSTATTEVYYIHADHLGTPRKITRPVDNKAVWSWEPEAFGNSLPDQNPSGLGNFVFSLRFPGQYYDKENGLFYNYFRDYDPKTGRYIESDPIGLNGGINTYGYVSGNPVNWIDPTGLIFIDPTGTIPDDASGPNAGHGTSDPCGCLSQAFDLSTLEEVAVGASGLPTIPYPRTGVGTGASTGATSIASSTLSSIFPQRVPIRIPTPTLANPGAGTAVLGRALGRWIPYAGWGMTAYDFSQYIDCMSRCEDGECGNAATK
jgi:RHS repeat-associated protein